MITPSAAIKALGGIKSGRTGILCPGPGHGKRDVSLSVIFGPEYPEGFGVHSFAGDDFRECRDFVRDKLGLPAWKPNGVKSQAQPVFVACEYVYEDANGEPYHMVQAMSDGSFRHHKFDIDGFVPGTPDLIVPYALPDVLTDETIWLVRGEHHAELIRDGFNQVATTYPSGLDLHTDASFIHHLAGRDVRILDTGGARSAEFCRAFSDALNAPVWRLPDGVKTLREFSRLPDASLDQCAVTTVSDVSSHHAVITPTPFEWIDPHLIPPREWLYDTHLIRKFVSLTVSPGGLGKSSLALIEALSLAIGRPLFNDATVHEPDPLRVWYWNGEDPQNETQRRVVAACVHYRLTPDAFKGRLFTDTGREQALTLGQIIRGEIALDEDLFVAIEEQMLAARIDVLILDPFVSAHRLGENDNNAIDAVIKRLGKLADRTNAAVEIVHHVRKPSGGNTAATDVNDARGASALLGGVRSARVLNVMSEEIAEAAAVPRDLRHRYFSITEGKANMSAKAAYASWRFLESVALGNQTDTRKTDNVGVVTYFKLPEAARVTEDLSQAEDEMRLILSTDDTVAHWSGRGQKPKNWLGHRILEALKIHDTDHDRAMFRLINGWIKEGKVITRDAWIDRNRKIFLTLPGASFEASPQPENEEDSPF